MRTLIFQALILGASFWVPPPLAAQGVDVRAGNVYFRGDFGKEKQLTASGQDTEATLSPDGRLVAFVRKTPNRQVEAGTGQVPANEIWTIRTDGTNLTRIAAGGDTPEMVG